MSIIDSLVVELGLDPTKFNEGQKAALDQYKKTTEGIDKHSKEAEKSIKGVENSFTNVTKAIGELTAGYLSVSGITNFIQSTNQANNTLGQFATTLGLMPEKIALYQRAAKLANVDPQSMTSSLDSLYKGMSAATIGKNPEFYAVAARLNAVNAVGSDDPTVMLQALARGGRKAIESGELTRGQVNNMLASVGISPDTIYMIERADGSLEKFLKTSEKFKQDTNAQVESSKNLLTNWNELSTALSKVGNSIARDLDGPLGALFDVMKKVIQEFTGFKDLIEIIGGMLVGSTIGAAIFGLIGLITGGPAGMIAGAALGARIGGAVGVTAGALLADNQAKDGVADSSNTPTVAGSGGGSSYRATQRAKMFAEYDKWTPEQKRTLAYIATHENAQDPAGVLESLANRTLGEKGTKLNPHGTLWDGITHGFYSTYAAAAAAARAGHGDINMIDRAAAAVRGGRDDLEGRSDQGMLSDPGHRDMHSGGRLNTLGVLRRLKKIHGEWYSDKQSISLESVRKDLEAQRAFDSNSVIPNHPAESWQHWLGRQVPSWLGGPSQPAVQNNKQSSLSIGNMNFHGVRDMNDVANNIEPYIKNRFTVVGADTGYG